jgi:hypothetical protein
LAIALSALSKVPRNFVLEYAHFIIRLNRHKQ